MTRAGGDDPLDELVALYAAGALPPSEAARFEARLAAGWPEAEAELARMGTAVLALTAELPAVAPPARVKAALLSRLAPAVPGTTFRFRDEGEFRPIPDSNGAFARVLHIDPRRKVFTAIVRMEPGARYPSHHHDGVEECLVLEGELIVGGVRMRPGDYQRAEPGTDHADQWSETGALLYLTAPLALLSG